MNSLYRRIVTMGMISFTAALAWVYCILTYSDKPVYIAAVSLVLVISVYALLNAFVGLRVTKDAKLQNYIYETINATLSKLSGEGSSEEMERLSKASYVQLRKSNTLLNQIAEDNSRNYNHSTEMYSELNSSTMKTITDSVNKAVKIAIKYNQANNQKLIDELAAVKAEISKIQINVPAPAENPSPDLNSFFDEFTDNGISNTGIDGYSSDNSEAAEPHDSPDKQLSPEEITALFEASKDEYRAKSNDDFQVHNHPEAMDQGLIDALLSNMPEEPAPTAENSQTEPEIADVIPFPSTENTEPDFDPNKQLSADEIAALFASMNPAAPASDEAADAAENLNIQYEAAEAGTDTNVLSSDSDSAQTSAASLNDDPNRPLSPEEIAALFASVH